MSWQAKAGRDAVVATWCFDAGDGDAPYKATIRFSGRRLDVAGKPGPGDRFERDEVVTGVVPGSGLVAVTTHVEGVNPGEWSVTARMHRGQPSGAWRYHGPLTHRDEPRLCPARWSWRRWRLETAPTHPVKTRGAPLAPLVSHPATLPGSWLTLVVVGVVAGLVLQRWVLAGEGLPTGRSLVISLMAVLVGFVGARVWCLILPGGSTRQVSLDAGWCIQGFLVGVAIALLVALPLTDIPIGRFFDATTPGLFVGLGIGRLGCFLTGCCCGRPTASRWGIWLSDGRVCARRLPVQLYEASIAVVVGLTALVLVRQYEFVVGGALFVGAAAAYTLVRQFLLQLRVERKSRGWKLTAAVAAALLVGNALILLVSAA